jgi:hypothetical protein
MRNLLIVGIILCLSLPAAAIDKTSLFSVGTYIFYWMPMGTFGEAYDATTGFGTKVGYGVAENLEILCEAWYGLAQFNEQYWGLNYRDYEEATPYLMALQMGARITFLPSNLFVVPSVQIAAGYYMWAVYKEVGEDADGDGDVDEYRYLFVSDESTRRFGINARLGGEFFTSDHMGVEVSLGWDSIFNVSIPQQVNTNYVGFRNDLQTVEETVNILTCGVGINLYF